MSPLVRLTTTFRPFSLGRDSSQNTSPLKVCVNPIETPACESISGVTGDTIYVGGSFTSIVGSTQNRLTRLTTGGTIDNSFNIGTGFNGIVQSLVEDSNKDLYVGGQYSTFTGSSNLRLVRLNSNGSKDTSFNNLGSSGFNSYVYSVFLDNTNNSVYVGGIFKTYSGRTVNRIAKLSNTGLLDTSFSNDSGVNLGYSTFSVN